MNRFQLRHSNGKWRKVTLQDFGIPKEAVNTSDLVCSRCGKKWFPVLKQDPCFDCQLRAEGKLPLEGRLGNTNPD